MTPVAIIFNLILFLIWRFRLVCLHWMFDKSNLAMLRYPEFEKYQIEISNKFDENVMLYYDLRLLFPRPIRGSFGVSVDLFVYDPVLYSLLSRSTWSNRILFGHDPSEVVNFIMSLFFRVPSKGFVLVDPRVYAYLALDVYSLMYLFGLPLTYSAIVVAVSWIGLYRFIGSQLLEPIVYRAVSKWVKNREFNKLSTIGLILLPISTADALVIFSLLDAKDGKNWDLNIRLVCDVYDAYDSNPDEGFIYELEKLGIFETIQNDFVRKEVNKVKKLVVDNLNGKIDSKDILKIVEKDTKEYLNKNVDKSLVMKLYMKEKLKRLPVIGDLLE